MRVKHSKAPRNRKGCLPLSGSSWTSESVPVEEACLNHETSDVRVRLGDVTFDTSVEALEKAGGMLAAMFAHEMRPGALDGAGAVILDRDPVFFNYVLRHVHGEELMLGVCVLLAYVLFCGRACVPWHAPEGMCHGVQVRAFVCVRTRAARMMEHGCALQRT